MFPRNLSALFSVAGRGPGLQFFGSNCTLTGEIGIFSPQSLIHVLGESIAKKVSRAKRGRNSLFI